MGEFAYTTVPGKIGQLLQKLREVGIPTKSTSQWLKSIGFTSSNDASLLGILKAIQFVNEGGVPTSNWTKYRGPEHKRILADAIRQGYSDLFAVYADAWNRSQDDLENVFRTISTGGKQVIYKAVLTFKNLCAEADFSADGKESSLKLETGPVHAPVGAAPLPVAKSVTPQSPSVHIDIQIHISPEATADQIDQVFKSMSKHLYGSEGNK